MEIMENARQQAEQEEEQVDDVEIELDGGDDVVVVPELARDEERVVDDEEAEEQRARERVRRAQPFVVEPEGEDARHDEQPERAVQPGAEEREVDLRLDGEEGEQHEE